MTTRMKFQQRVLVLFFLICIAILYVWVKIKAENSRRNPVVESANDDSFMRTLLLNGRLDFNNLDHVHKNSRFLSRDKRTTRSKYDNDKNTKEISLMTRKSVATSYSQYRTTKTTVPVSSLHTILNRPPWELWREMVKEREVTQPGREGTAKVNAIVKALQTSPVVLMSVGYRGTQLKASMFLQGKQRTVFKPKRYERDYIVGGGPYSGYDRHNGEIAAFHLDRILGFYRAPIVTGRIVNVKTDIPQIQPELKKTFFQQGNNTCFYGVCYYCKRDDPACADGNLMEGSVTIWLPEGWNLKTWRHPWQRTYRANKKARWEVDPMYCINTVMKTLPYSRGPRLMSIIDTAIFDYFIGNADRHHYETFVKGGDDALVLHLDNGKSFGNPDWDELSILAPLYQCCRILGTTWQKIKALDNQKDKKLSEVLKKSLNSEPLAPVLSQRHLDAIDRRLKKIVESVEECIKKHGERAVVLVDYS